MTQMTIKSGDPLSMVPILGGMLKDPRDTDVWPSLRFLISVNRKTVKNKGWAVLCSHDGSNGALGPVVKEILC